MRIIPLAFIWIAFIGSLPAGEPPPAPIAASDGFRTALSIATRIEVYEGLPAVTEAGLFDGESKRKDITRFLDHYFYFPAKATPAESPEVRLLMGSTLLAPFSGVKRCGGFHPDYAIRWEHRNTSYHALICFGCEEIKFVQGKTVVLYDLSASGSESLRKNLARFDSKRPGKVP